MAASTPSLAPFVWGSSGEALSPDENKRRRLLAEALIAKGIDTSPIQHPTQGFARIAQALAGNIALGRIDAEEATARKAGTETINSALATALGGAPAAPAATTPKAEGPVNPSFATMQGVPQSSRFDDLFRSTTERYGLPADYLPRTAQIESGMNPNAKNPNSSAGGLYQFINGTAAQYGLENRFDPEAATDAAGRLARDNAKHLASVLGRNPTSGELYLAHQQGAGGAAKLLSNPDAPAEQVLGGAAFRLNGGAPGMTAGQFAQKWTGKFGSTIQPGPVQLASAGGDDTGSGAFLSSRQEARDSAAPVMPAQAPQMAQARQQAAPAAMGQNANMSRALPLIRALDNPYLSAGQRAAGQAVLQRVLSQEQKTPAQIEKENLDLEKARLDVVKTRRETAGPGYDLDVENKRLANAKAQKDLKDKPNGEIIRDAATGEVLYIDKNNPDGGVKVMRAAGPSSTAPTTRQIKQPDGSEVVVQWNPTSRAWEPMAAPQGGEAVRAPNKLTEQQSKDVGFYNRGQKIIDRLEKQDEALTSFWRGSAMDHIPGGNFGKSDEYRQAQQTGLELLAVILRKDTGAAVTKDESELYGSIYLPKPGDDKATIDQKRQSRRTALDGIRMGLGPAEIIFKSQQELEARKAKPGEKSAAPATGGPKPGDVQDGHMFKGGDPRNPASWEKVR